MAVSTIFSDRFQKAISGLRELMRGYPGMEMGHHLDVHLQELGLQATAFKEYPVEVLFLDTPREQQLLPLFRFLQVDEQQGTELLQHLNNPQNKFVYTYTVGSASAGFTMQVYNSAHLPVRSTGKVVPCLKFVFGFAEDLADQDEIEPILLRLQAEGGVLVAVYNSSDSFISSAERLKVIPIRLDSLPGTFEDLLSKENLTPLLPLLHSDRLLHGLEKISESFDQYITQQEKDLKTKKFNAQQDINAVKLEEKLNLRELFQQIKGELQRNFSECERTINDQLVKTGQKHSGNSLMAKVEQQVQEVDHLEEENFAGSLRMTLPAGTHEKLLFTISQGLRTHIEQDVFSFREFVKQETDALMKELKKHGVSFSYTPRIQVNLSRLEANMLEYISFTQKYEIEKKQLQFTDYTRAAMAPIMGFMSLFVLSRLVAPLGKILNEYMWVLAFILIPLSIYSFSKFLKNTKVRKAHDYETDLNRMRESLLAESKGMIRKITEEWQREIVSALREELALIINAVEQVFSSASEDHKDKVQVAQRSVQRRVQGLEQRERGHQTIAKNKETFDRSLAQFKGELMNQYQQSIQKL